MRGRDGKKSRVRSGHREGKKREQEKGRLEDEQDVDQATQKSIISNLCKPLKLSAEQIVWLSFSIHMLIIVCASHH